MTLQHFSLTLGYIVIVTAIAVIGSPYVGLTHWEFLGVYGFILASYNHVVTNH